MKNNKGRKFSDYDGKTKSGKKKVDCWSKKNKELPNEVSYGSGKKFWFDCDNCPHEFKNKLCSITGKSRWCPYCVKPSKLLCDNNECDFCLKKSFASYKDKTKNWKKEG